MDLAHCLQHRLICKLLIEECFVGSIKCTLPAGYYQKVLLF